MLPPMPPLELELEEPPPPTPPVDEDVLPIPLDVEPLLDAEAPPPLLVVNTPLEALVELPLLPPEPLESESTSLPSAHAPNATATKPNAVKNR